MDKIIQLQHIIDKSRYIVFFGGAGVSCESNIPDFRSVDGLYNQSYDYPPEEIISHSFFEKNPNEFYKFYKEKMMYPNAKPNPAHIKLAQLEKSGKLKAVITQNIDGLHQMAGSENVYELHGSIHRNYCTKCRRFYSADYILSSKGIPYCEYDHSIIKPDVVLYEEPLDSNMLNEAVSHIEKADTLIIGGTSLNVYPAAGLIKYFTGDNMVLINKSATPYDSYADLIINDAIGEVLSQIEV